MSSIRVATVSWEPKMRGSKERLGCKAISRGNRSKGRLADQCGIEEEEEEEEVPMMRDGKVMRQNGGLLLLATHSTHSDQPQMFAMAAMA